MPRDTNQTYSLPEAPFVAGTVASPTAVNANLSDIAAALTASLTRGETTVFTRSLLDDADAATARGTLGGTATGSAVFTAADAAAARATLAIPIEVIQRQTVGAAVGAVDFVLPAGYASFRIMFDDVRFATSGATLWLRGSVDSGAIFLAGGQYAWAATYNNNTATAVGATAAAVAQGVLSGAASMAATDLVVSGEYRFSVGSATRRAMFCGQSSCVDVALAVPVVWGGHVQIVVPSPVNAIRLLANAGNITGGTFTLMGVRA